MTTPRMTEQELAEAHRRIRISKSKVRSTDSAGRHGRAQTQSLGRSENRQGLTKSASSPYKSKWEAAYASKLEMEKRAGVIKAYWYEPFSLWLPGKIRYKPDFLVQYHSMVQTWTTHPNTYTVELVEVKGWSKNRRDGMTRLKIAAALFPCFIWTLVRKTKDGWEEEQP